MASAAERLDSLDLSAIELKALTGWDDAIVEEWLNFFRNFIGLAVAIDENADDIRDVSVATAAHETLYIPLKYLPTTVSVSADYSTAGDQTIICINADPATVYLNNTPEDLEEVTVQRSRATVTVDGNGKQIIGDGTVVMNTQYSSLVFVYSADIDEWVIT